MNQFRNRIRQSIDNAVLQTALDANAERRKQGRLAAFASLPDYQERRQRAHAIKAEVIAHLDRYLAQFVEKVQANSIIVHRAADSAEAVKIVLKIVEKDFPVTVAKSKSMVSEEINLNHALEAAGIQVVETDLGEYIVQLRGERPSHIITPAIHLRRQDVGHLFQEKLGIPYTEDIPDLTATARRVLREVFLSADIGVSGVNFGVVETGTLVLVTNEGNGRMVTTLPPVHIALMGIERLVPTLDNLALFLSLLPRSATGQKLSVYTSLIHSPRRSQDADGPQERHLILVDNGRSALRTSHLAQALYCIRCGACLNACPVFREIGGHAYVGTDGSIAPYPGPIGSVVSPGLFGCKNFGHLAQASSLCGACREACPVDIDLPGLLLRVRAGFSPQRTRRNTKEGIGIPFALKFGLKAFRLAAQSPILFAVGQRLGGLLSRIYSPRLAYMRLPAWTGWGYSKDFPRMAARTFRSRWQSGGLAIRGAGDQASQSTDLPIHQSTDLPTYQSSNSPIYQFTSELEALGGHAYRVLQKDMPARLVKFLKSRGVERVYVDAVGAKYVTSIPIVREPDPSVRCGLTSALAGVAETGSLVLVGGPGHPLTASLLPEIHIVILKESDIYNNLAKVFNLRQVRGAPAAVLVTGPSRTADIEMALTIGVHGPKELHVFLIDDSTPV